MEPSRRGPAHACRVVLSTPPAPGPPARPTRLDGDALIPYTDVTTREQEEKRMAMYWKEITVNWGESDPFGLVYYPRIVAWFNDTEHELFRVIGYPIEQMIKNDRTTFVMGEIHFRFIGPAAYGDRIVNTITLAEVGNRTLHWNCKAKNAVTGAPVSEGKATRVYARINEDGSLSSQPIPVEMLTALNELGSLTHLKPNSGATRLGAER
jgi:acyl-CoA thioesterase FadM